MRRTNIKIGASKPVLIEQGFDLGILLAGDVATQKFTTAVDRGNLSHLDVAVFPGVTTDVLNDLGNFTISVGGQNVVENSSFMNYAINSQYGKTKDWPIRCNARENQTLEFRADLTDSVITKAWQLIASYTDKEYREWANSIVFKYNQGLKRKGYQVNAPISPVGQVATIRETLPKFKGGVIGFAISNAAQINNQSQFFQTVTLKIDGMTVIETVCGGYYNIASGRDNYFKPMQIKPGATFELIIENPVQPSTEDVIYDLEFYFNN